MLNQERPGCRRPRRRCTEKKCCLLESKWKIKYDLLRFSLLLNRTVFTPWKDPLRPPPVLAADGSQEASGASPRKRLSRQLCSRPLRPALLSLRKLVSLDLWPMPYAEPRASRLPSSPSSLHHLLPTYHPLASSTSNGARGQVQRVREEKFSSAYTF